MPTHLDPSGGKRMPEKSMKEKLAAGELVLCMNLRLARSVDIAMVAKAGGYDALYVDMQHAPYSIETAAPRASSFRMSTPGLRPKRSSAPAAFRRSENARSWDWGRRSVTTRCRYP